MWRTYGRGFNSRRLHQTRVSRSTRTPLRRGFSFALPRPVVSSVPCVLRFRQIFDAFPTQPSALVPSAATGSALRSPWGAEYGGRGFGLDNLLQFMRVDVGRKMVFNGNRFLFPDDSRFWLYFILGEYSGAPPPF